MPFEDKDKSRSILIRIIVTDDSAARDRIIKATNFQTRIPDASLRATDKIQRDIEDYFKEHDWYYDRRKNYYKNLGKPIDKIVGIPYLAQAVMAIILKEPHIARGRPTSLIKKDEDYSKIFSNDLNPVVYLLCAQMMRTIDNYLRTELQAIPLQEKTNFRFHIAMVATPTFLEKMKGDIEENRIVNESIEEATIKTLDWVKKYVQQHGGSLDTAAKSKDFTKYLINELAIEKN